MITPIKVWWHSGIANKTLTNALNSEVVKLEKPTNLKNEYKQCIENVKGAALNSLKWYEKILNFVSIVLLSLGCYDGHIFNILLNTATANTDLSQIELQNETKNDYLTQLALTVAHKLALAKR